MLNFCARAALIAASVVLIAHGAAAQSSVGVVVADAACDALSGSDLAAGAELVPGVDVHGRPVVAADLPGSRAYIPMPVTFDVSIDLARRLGMPLDREALLTVAQVSERDGEILINGRPASELGRAMAAMACEGQFRPH